MPSQKGKLNEKEAEILAKVEHRAEEPGPDQELFHSIRNLIVGLHNQAMDNYEFYQDALREQF